MAKRYTETIFKGSLRNVRERVVNDVNPSNIPSYMHTSALENNNSSMVSPRKLLYI